MHGLKNDKFIIRKLTDNSSNKHRHPQLTIYICQLMRFRDIICIPCSAIAKCYSRTSDMVVTLTTLCRCSAIAKCYGRTSDRVVTLTTLCRCSAIAKCYGKTSDRVVTLTTLCRCCVVKPRALAI